MSYRDKGSTIPQFLHVDSFNLHTISAGMPTKEYPEHHLAKKLEPHPSLFKLIKNLVTASLMEIFFLILSDCTKPSPTYNLVASSRK